MACDVRESISVWIAGPVMIAAALLAGCSDGTNDPEVTEKRWDFLGTVAQVRREPGFTTSTPAFTTGGQAHEAFAIGPMELTMTDGTVLQVPAATPGGNYCLQFLTDEERLGATGLPAPEGLADEAVKESLNGLRDACVVIAEIGEDEEVERFEILPTEEDGGAVVGALLEQRGDRYLTGSGYVFEVSPDVNVSCGETRTLDDLFESGLAEHALVDVATGRIELVACLGRM